VGVEFWGVNPLVEGEFWWRFSLFSSVLFPPGLALKSKMALTSLLDSLSLSFSREITLQRV